MLKILHACKYYEYDTLIDLHLIAKGKTRFQITGTCIFDDNL